MDQRSYDDLVDLIYDAAVEPHLWGQVMERFADAIGGASGWLSQLNMLDGGGEGVIARIDPLMPDLYLSHFAQRNPLSNVANPHEYLRNWRPRILTDEDWMPKDELIASEYYNDFLVPQDIHSTMMIRLATRGYEVAALNINRPERSGQFGGAELEFAQRLHPHLIRAFNLCQKFAALHQINDGMAELFDRSPHGLFLLDDTGRIRHANRAAMALLEGSNGLAVRGARLTACAPADAKRLAAMIVAAAIPGHGAAGSMPLASPSRRLPLSLTVAPARGEPFSVFHRGPRVMVCVTDPDAGVDISQQKLRDLFGLTAAEARVAIALFDGASPGEAAAEFGVTLSTVRAQLASIFQKTGAGRQSELIRLMMRTIGVTLD